jgi:restriction system protein
MATRKRNGELMRGLFEVLMDKLEGLPVAEVLEAVEERVPPTPHEEEDYPNKPGVRRYEKTVRFATIGPVKAGWLIKNKGQWSLTEDGRAAYHTFTDPTALQHEWSRLYKEWKKAQRQPDEEDEPDPSEDEAVSTFEEAEEGAWATIRNYLGKMPPYEFQNLVATLLAAMGYHVLWDAPPGPDQGIDIIAHTDPLGTSSPRIKVQVKRQVDTKISRGGVNSFVGTLGNQDVGIFVSAGGFTAEAEREARSQEQRRVTLIDLDRLVELWIEHFAQLNDADRQRLPLKPIYFLAPPE